MAKAEASVEELVGMVERGELRLPEMQFLAERRKLNEFLEDARTVA